MTPAEKREWQQRRRDYLVSGMCAVCGGLPHDVHEILAGANRQAAWKEPACWLRVCRTCHDNIQGTQTEFQLAVKLLRDPDHYDLDAFCKAWGRPGTAINPSWIIEFARQLLISPEQRHCQSIRDAKGKSANLPQLSIYDP